MNTERWRQVREVLDRAIALPADARPAYLERTCASDTELRVEVESLLRSHERAGNGFLNTPVVDLRSLVPDSNERPSYIGRRVGVYKIVEEIGHGGMGEVYRASRVDGQYDKQVAIKLVRVGLDTPALLERFRTERQILASLDHPNIARLLDGGTTDDGVPFLVMELIEGERIDVYCDEHKLTITRRLELFRQVCSAVQFAHQRLVIHRDIKPSNILVTKEGIPKLLDFGIAKILDPSAASGAETTVARPMTPEYASPEQIRGGPITTASDVYSLGVVLYQLLTGRSPYPAETTSAHALAQAICETDPDRPSTAFLKHRAVSNDEHAGLTPEQVSRVRETSPAKLRRRLAGDLDSIVLQALRKEPHRRYASVEQFAEDIRRHMEGLPVFASKDSWSYRAGKFVRRNRAGMTATALVGMTLIVGLIVTLREARIAAFNQRRAERRFDDVRKLANSLMLDAHGSLARPPSSTTARKLIVQRSLEYLDSLYQESSGDVSLQRELAAAYESLGNVQGNPYQPHLGDSTAAMASYGKALALRQAVASSRFATAEDQMAMAGTLQKIGSIQWLSNANTANALESLNKSIAMLEALNPSRGSDIQFLRQLGESYDKLADIQAGNGPRGSMGDIRAGLETNRKNLEIRKRILELKPDDPASQIQLARAFVGIGDDLVKLGERNEAMQYFRQAASLEQPLAGTPGVDRGLSSCYSRMGDDLVISERPLEATRYFRRQFGLVKPLADADPQDVDLQTKVILSRASLGNALVEAGRISEGTPLLITSLSQAEKLARTAGDTLDVTILAFVEVWLGEALESAHRFQEAGQYYARALQRYSSVSASDPKDLEDRVSVAMVEAHLGRVFEKLGRFSQADVHYHSSLQEAQSAFAENPESMEVQYALADSFAGLGNLHAEMSRVDLKSEERHRHAAEAIHWRKQSAELWRKIPSPTRIAPNGFEVEDPREIIR